MLGIRRSAVVLVLLAIACVAGGAYAYWHFLIRGPFAGETAHDFGDVPLGDGATRVEHTFVLTNRLGRPLNIVAVRPECGCVAVSDMRLTLQPGDSFNLPVTLQARAGERVADIHVLFDDDTQATLKVRAVGRPLPVLRLADRTQDSGVALAADGTAECAVTLDTYATFAAPALPAITTSDPSLTTAFVESSWTLEHRPKDVQFAPTIWRARLRVRWVGDAATVPSDATITLTMPLAKPLTVAIALRAAVGAASPAPTTAPARATTDQ